MDLPNLQGVFRFVVIVTVLEIVLRLALIWQVLDKDRGVDRLCWFLVLISMPIFGEIAYVLIRIPERAENSLESMRSN